MCRTNEGGDERRKGKKKEGQLFTTIGTKQGEKGLGGGKRDNTVYIQSCRCLAQRILFRVSCFACPKQQLKLISLCVVSCCTLFHTFYHSNISFNEFL